jgi:hypothetical protein
MCAAALLHEYTSGKHGNIGTLPILFLLLGVAALLWKEKVSPQYPLPFYEAWRITVPEFVKYPKGI